MTVQVVKELDTPLDQARDRYLSDFELFETNGANAGPSWIHRIRKDAISRFAELGLPTTRLEEWKYTGVAPIARIRFRRAECERTGSTATALSGVTLGESACAQIVFVNGRYSPERSLFRSLPAGVKAGSLQTALTADPALVEPNLARHASFQNHAFVALNTAFFADGAFVYVPKGTIVEKPIHLVFVSTAQATPTVSYPRNLIVVDHESQVTVVESYIGLTDDVYFTNVVTEIVGGQHAVIAHYKVQEESEEAFHISTVQASLARSSNFLSHSLALGGALVRNDVNAALEGEGIECTLDGLYMVTDDQHVDNHTRIDHLKPHCSSRELYKGVLGGKSRGVFNGKIYVHKDAQKTDAKQTNKNLLLSEGAVINTKPQLEIYADDVKCTHGSTIGQLDQDCIFYMRSRGIGQGAARSLLTSAFASEMTGRITIDALRARLENRISARLQNGSQPRTHHESSE